MPTALSRHPLSHSDQRFGHAPAHQRPRGAHTKAIVREVWAGFTVHGLQDLGAALTYYAVFSLFPAALAVLSLAGLFLSRGQALDQVLQLATDVGGQSFVENLRGPLEALADRGGSGWALAIGTVVAVSGAVGYVAGFGRACNRIRSHSEHRGFVRVMLSQLGFTAGIIVLTTVLAAALVIGPGIATDLDRTFGGTGTLPVVWSIVRIPLLVLVAFTVLWLLRSSGADGSQPWLSWGAALSIVGAGAVTALLGWYVSHLAHFSVTYGTLGALIGALLWLWVVNQVLLFGVEVDRACAVVRRVERLG